MDLRALLSNRSFPMAATGYAPTEVRARLSVVDAALAAGEDLVPLLRPSFALVGFGYDPAAVDDLFARLRDAVGVDETPVGPDSTPNDPAPQAAAPAPEAPDPAPAERRRAMVEMITGARFHLARGTGYDPTDVDAWLDRLKDALVEGHAVGDDLMGVRFHTVRGRGYDPADVDTFIDDLAHVDAGGEVPERPDADDEPKGWFRGLFS